MRRLFRLTFLALLLPSLAFAIQPDKKDLPIGLADFEAKELKLNPPLARSPLSAPPVGEIHSLGEWEEAEAAMTLWSNSSLVAALAANGKVKLFADSQSDKRWWQDWLRQNGIGEANVSFFIYPTNSIWIRDYGPWYIVDGSGTFGIVDTVYNRPRPLDDVIPQHLARELNLPIFHPQLVHTGGNYYNDGMGNAFSSTMVYRENSSLNAEAINSRMRDFLGIERYTTSRLAPGVTIEHIDTFGKLVTPDTWVFSQFPSDSQFYGDSEEMVRKIQALKSPYGTPYKIFRMPMIDDSGWESYRAYINSFISNGALYFPAYGDEYDDAVMEIYAQALPGYKIVGVEAEDTEWGDSVHCRNRNLLKRNTIFIFPKMELVEAASGKKAKLKATIYASPGATLNAAPVVHWRRKGELAFQQIPMRLVSPAHYEAESEAFAMGSELSFYVEAADSAGVTKTAPIRAPEMLIDVKVE